MVDSFGNLHKTKAKGLTLDKFYRKDFTMQVLIHGWVVYVHANIRRGNLYDYGTIPVFVEWKQARTIEEARKWILKNQSQVLEYLDRLKTHYRGGGKRIIKHPVRDNVFFSQFMTVKSQDRYRCVPQDIQVATEIK